MVSPELAAELARLERLVVLERELARRRVENRLDTMRWLPGQHRFLLSPAKRKLFRSGSQAQGKTTAGAAETVYRLLGHHPLREIRPAPVRMWAVCGGGEQSAVVQERVWSLVPKSEVVAGCAYDAKKGGFLGKYPRLRLRNGSELLFKTGQQDTLNLASDTVDAVWIDEPPESERVLNELVKRVLRTNGDIYGTLTPVNRPVDYLRKLCEDDVWDDIHSPLTVENMVFVGTNEVIRLADGTPCDARWIALVRAETPPHEAPVTLDGGWEFRTEGGYFASVWDPARMVTENPPTGEYEELLGIDLGDRPGKQYVGYILVDETGGARGYPHVHIEDEYVGETGRETNEDDAIATLRMLKRHRSKWASLRSAMSDRAHKAGRGDQKSATDLARAIAAELGLTLEQLEPPIRVAKRGRGRGAGSVSTRSRWLHGQMARGNVTVHPRCKRLIEAIPKYSPWVDDDWKDPLDGVLYGLDRYIYATQRRTGRVVEVW